MVTAKGRENAISRTGAREPSLRELLLWSTIDSIADDGLERLSLRTIASRVGATTAAIVHHFKNKSGLLTAVTQLAFAADRDFHASIGGIALTQKLSQQGFVEWIAWYITRRANERVAIFWSELVFKATTVVDSQGSILAWYDLRCQFWTNILIAQELNAEIAPFLVAYLCMEEVCAQGLTGRIEYELLMRESVWTLTAASFGVPSVIDRSVSSVFDAERRAFVIPVDKDRDSAADRLLNLASKDLLNRGIHSINQRKLGKDAGTSASMIIYYFGSMVEFETQAIWRAMVQGGYPAATNPNSDQILTNTMDKWASVMAKTICASHSDAETGYYCNFARIAGEVSLLSRRRPEMKELIEHLRMLDGSASYGASKTIWRDAVALTRNQAAAFAMWVKGYAVLSNILKYPVSDLEENLKKMTTAIVKMGNG